MLYNSFSAFSLVYDITWFHLLKGVLSTRKVSCDLMVDNYILHSLTVHFTKFSRFIVSNVAFEHHLTKTSMAMHSQHVGGEVALVVPIDGGTVAKDSMEH